MNHVSFYFMNLALLIHLSFTYCSEHNNLHLINDDQKSTNLSSSHEPHTTDSYNWIDSFDFNLQDDTIASSHQKNEDQIHINQAIEHLLSMHKKIAHKKLNLLENKILYEIELEALQNQEMTYTEYERFYELFSERKNYLDTRTMLLSKKEAQYQELHFKTLANIDSHLGQAYQTTILAQDKSEELITNNNNTVDEQHDINIPTQETSRDVDPINFFLPIITISDSCDDTQPSPIQTHKRTGKRSFAELMEDPSYYYLPQEPREYDFLQRNRTQTSHYDDTQEEQRKKELKKLINNKI